MLIATIERLRSMNRENVQCSLELPSALPNEGRLQTLWKEFKIHDEDGNETGRRREKAATVTVLRVGKPIDVLELGMDVARGCGFKTVQGLQEDWAARHPRSPLAAAVWFAFGDWRDRDLFMNWTGRAPGDYTRSARRALDADAPVLTREEIDALSAVNHQKDDARRARASAALAQETPSQRLLRIERYIENVRQQLGEDAARYVEREIRQERRIIDQRVSRAERRVP